jgi:hypothetical protein
MYIAARGPDGGGGPTAVSRLLQLRQASSFVSYNLLRLWMQVDLFCVILLPMDARSYRYVLKYVYIHMYRYLTAIKCVQRSVSCNLVQRAKD